MYSKCHKGIGRKIYETMLNSKGYGIFCCLLVLSVLWILYGALTTEDSGDDHIFSIETKYFHRLIYGKEAENTSNWIIVTTDSPQHINYTWLTHVKNWSVIIVIDIPDHRQENGFIKLMNKRGQGRGKDDSLFTNRTLAYLHAISQGAQIIYELDSYNELSSDWEKQLRFETSSYQLQYSELTVFNAYRHFGQSSLWPRGFPLDQRKECSNLYHVADGEEPVLIQVLSNGEADVDDNYRMTLTSKLNITFDNVAPTVILPVGVMAPINSKNTLFRYSALWATVLPLTPPSEQRDIIRGYWAQRLLWELNSSVGIYPPNGRQLNNNSIHDSQSKFPISKFIDFLINWTCELKLTFFQCVKNLSKKMADVGFWGLKDYQNICSWLEKLLFIGYTEPIRQSNTTQHYVYSVSYQPTETSTAGSSGEILPTKWHQMLGITSFCKNSSFQINSESLAFVYSPNILLVIVFSEPFYDNLPYLQLLYGLTFSHIVVCGVNTELFKNTSRKFHEKVTFVEVEVNHGHFGYKCLLAAMMMGYDVRGYLLIGDDTLVNVWKISSFPLDKIWFPAASFTLLFRNQTNPWHWWQTKEGRGVFNKAWSEIQQLANSSSEMEDTINNFTNVLKSNTGSELGLYHGPSDFIYIPREYRRTTIILLEIFARHNVFLEVVVPTFIAGLVDKKHIVNVQCQYLWYDGKREKVPELFKSEDVFLHPVKLSEIKSKLRHFFCHKYFPLLLKTQARQT